MISQAFKTLCSNLSEDDIDTLKSAPKEMVGAIVFIPILFGLVFVILGV